MHTGGMGPGRWDWTRNKDSAKAMLKDRLEKSNKKKKPWEEKIIKILSWGVGLIVLFYLISWLIDIL